MLFLVGILLAILFSVIVIQIGNVMDLASRLRNTEEVEEENNRFHGALGMIFMVGFLVFVILSFYYYKDSMFGYGPWTSSSEHGVKLDFMFNVTMVLTGIVFFLTHILLFWYAWKYRARKGHKGVFWAHDEKLELVWMGIPAIVMTFLVVGGIQTWNEATADVKPGEDYIEIEATGMQFAWLLRYPGKDNVLGDKYFANINSRNPLGQLWTDQRNLDDFHPDKIVLPVGKTVRVRITSRDVLHNFYLPHFRVKMDAVPGMPTYFKFTPTVTTDSMRTRLSKYPEWQVADEDDPSLQRWETFVYELACAELCGKSHFSMRTEVKIVSPEEYEAWLKEQTSFYASQVKGTVEDPYKEIGEATSSDEEKTEEKEEEASSASL